MRTMPVRAAVAVDDHERHPAQCWCCGTTDDPARMVRLGNHPEVALCVRCARWVAKSASRIEDRDRTGPLVAARELIRVLRRGIVERGWQRSRLFGRALRWLGKYLP